MNTIRIDTLFDFFKLDVIDGEYIALLSNNEEIPIQVYNYGNVTYLENENIPINKENIPLVILKYKNLTIEKDVVLTTSDPCRGMCIYAQNIVNNGNISMTARGGTVEGQNVRLLRNSDASYEEIPADGSAGGLGAWQSGAIAGGTYYAANGANGVKRGTGGGGAGGGRGYTGGSGAKGSSYSGGSGGGGSNNGAGGNGEINGGKGGNSASYVGGGQSWGGAGSGAGNPAGNLVQDGSSTGYKGQNGTGGLLIIYCHTITNNGLITSHGSGGGGAYRAGGGGSGGGSINIFGNILIKGTITATGGARGWVNRGGEDTYGGAGGAGGAGSVTLSELNFQNYFIKLNNELKYIKDSILYTLNKNENNITQDDFMSYGIINHEFEKPFLNGNKLSLLVSSTSDILKYSRLLVDQKIENKNFIAFPLKYNIYKMKITDILNLNIIKYIFNIKNKWYWWNINSWQEIDINDFSENYGGNTSEEINNFNEVNWMKFNKLYNIETDFFDRELKICLLISQKEYMILSEVSKIEVWSNAFSELTNIASTDYSVDNYYNKYEIKWTGTNKKYIKIYYV